MGLDDEEFYDDNTVGLQLQQFLDEWHYRVLHSNLALTWDGQETVVRALEIMEANGLRLKAEEREEIANIDDEQQMIRAIVQKMPMECRKGFEHFSLQVMLAISTATRLRGGLDEGSVEEVARIMEEGDTGITQQILRFTVIEAAQEMKELKEIHTSWEKNMNKRVDRLTRCNQEAEMAGNELRGYQAALSTFGDDQNKKSKSVLNSMASNNDRMLTQTAFQAWFACWGKFKSERHIHDKYLKQIAEAEKKLFDYKFAQSERLKKVLQKNWSGKNKDLQKELVRQWRGMVDYLRDERAIAGALAAQEERMNSMKAAQKDNAKKSLLRMAGGNADALKDLCFDMWSKIWAEAKKNKDYEDQVKATEAMLQDFVKKKSEEAKGVLNRMMGSTAQGLLAGCMKEWVDLYTHEKKTREMEELVNAQGTKFANLNARQKDHAMGAAGRANELEDEILVQRCFMDWSTEMLLHKEINYFGSRLDKKKQQLDAVQHMFKSFATQLEQGIAATPRSQRTKGKSGRTNKDGQGSERPPQLPAA